MALASFKTRAMNKTETAYFRQLRDQMAVGLIKWFDFECMKFRLADNTFYTPDFILVTADDHFEAHEVKAYWQSAGRVGFREDARVKIKCVAEMYPMRFRVAVLMANGVWEYENLFDESSSVASSETSSVDAASK